MSARSEAGGAATRVDIEATIEPSARAVATQSGLVEEMIVHAERPPGVREVAFSSGRSVVMESGASDQLTVSSPDGRVELSVRFTPEGPVLSFAAAALRLASAGEIALDCDQFRVHARSGIAMESGGDLTQKVEGAHSVQVTGASRTEARQVHIKADRGDVVLKANDDVKLDGERILLNS